MLSVLAQFIVTSNPEAAQAALRTVVDAAKALG